MNGIELAVVIVTTAISAGAIGFTAGSTLTRKDIERRIAGMRREMEEMAEVIIANGWHTSKTVTPRSHLSSSSSSYDSTTGFVAGSVFGSGDSGSSGSGGGGGCD